MKVSIGGQPAHLRTEPNGLVIEDAAGTRRLGWSDIENISFPSDFALNVTTGGQALSIAFIDRKEARSFRDFLAAQSETTGHQVAARPAPNIGAKAVLLVTTPDLGPVPISKIHGMVSGCVVISRNLFSDFGSDIKSGLGGRLHGVEKAVRQALLDAESELREAAWVEGANAAVGVQLSTASVTEKATLLVASGTAVTADFQDETVDPAP